MNLEKKQKKEKKQLRFPALHPETVIKKSGSDDQPYIVGLAYKKFFKVGEIEYKILQLLDGRRSPEDIQQEFLKSQDLEIPLETIRGFIKELVALEIVTCDFDVSRKKYIQIKIPDFIYRFLSVAFNPIFMGIVTLFNVAGFVYFILNITDVFQAATPYYSLYFPILFILVYLLTSVFHELGHGAAIRYNKCIPEPIRIRRGNGVFLLHFSTPFITNVTEKPVSKWMKLTILGGGLYFDFFTVSSGMLIFKLFPHGFTGILGILLVLTGISRILITFNFFYENTDLAKILNICFENNPKFKENFIYKLIGIVFWLIQYSVFFYLVFIVLYSVRNNVPLAFSAPGIIESK